MFNQETWFFCKTFGSAGLGMLAAISFKQSAEARTLITREEFLRLQLSVRDKEGENRASLAGKKAGEEAFYERSQQIYEKTVPYYLRGLLPKPDITITIADPIITLPPPPPAPSPDPSSRNPDTVQLV